MITFKDIYDLIDDLRQKTKNQQILNATLPIEKALLEAQKEALTRERALNSHISQLENENLELQREKNELMIKIQELERKSIEHVGIVNPVERQP